MRLCLLLIALLFLVGCGRSVLPSERAMTKLSESELRSMVLTNTPVGMHRADVEKALRRSFHREWHVVDYESAEAMSGRFTVPVFNNDYYFRSDFATVLRNLYSSDVITVYLLFGPTHQLKDVVVKKWTDSI